MQEIIVEKCPWWLRIAVVENKEPIEFIVDLPQKGDFTVGNIYKGKIKNVVPSMQAVYVDIGSIRNSYQFVNSPDDMKKYEPGADILVQIKKEETDEKGAKVSDKITVPGKYVVITNERRIGVSTKIRSKSERLRLRRILSSLMERAKSDYEYGVVARTEAEGVPEEMIEKDFFSVQKIYEDIKKKFHSVKAPALIFSDSDSIRRVIREFASEKLERIVLNSEDIIEKVRQYYREYMGDRDINIEFKNTLFLFQSEGIEDYFRRSLSEKIVIEKGIEIIFNELEAFTAIDVNTGSFLGEENMPTTAYEANLIAAREIVKEIRRRRLGGIIIIDFIDIKNVKLRRKFLQDFKELVKKDKFKVKVFGLTRLGLLEMTRKRAGSSLKKTLFVPCHECGGTGFEPGEILRVEETLMKILSSGAKSVKLSPNLYKIVSDYLKDTKIDLRIQPKYGLKDTEIEIG